MTLLAVQDLEVCYGESRILARVSLTVEAGHVVCVMGRNGVGKTTLLKAIMGLVAPRRGRILLRDHAIGGLPPYARARRGIGYVPQGREIFPALTVRENLVLAARGARPEPEVVEAACALFPALSALLGRRGGDLSGGQQQQLAIARALAADPALLILDEPTEGIQPSIVEEIAAVLDRFRRAGDRAVLLVEQSLEFAQALADRTYVLEGGGVALEGRRGEVRPEDLAPLLSV